MKIQSKKFNHRNTKRIFSRGIEVEFDDNRVADVSDSVGEMLLTNYPNIFCHPGEVEVTEEKPVTVQEKKQEPFMKAKINEQEKKIVGLEKQLKTAKEEVIIWRAECQRLSKEVEDYKDRLFKYEGEVREQSDRVDDTPVGDTETTLKAALEKKTKAELIEMARELKLPDNDWRDLNKGPLIDYLIDKTK